MRIEYTNFGGQFLACVTQLCYNKGSNIASISGQLNSRVMLDTSEAAFFKTQEGYSHVY